MPHNSRSVDTRCTAMTFLFSLCHEKGMSQLGAAGGQNKEDTWGRVMLCLESAYWNVSKKCNFLVQITDTLFFSHKLAKVDYYLHVIAVSKSWTRAQGDLYVKREFWFGSFCVSPPHIHCLSRCMSFSLGPAAIISNCACHSLHRRTHQHLYLWPIRSTVLHLFFKQLKSYRGTIKLMEFSCLLTASILCT